MPKAAGDDLIVGQRVPEDVLGLGVGAVGRLARKEQARPQVQLHPVGGRAGFVARGHGEALRNVSGDALIVLFGDAPAEKLRLFVPAHIAGDMGHALIGAQRGHRAVRVSVLDAAQPGQQQEHIGADVFAVGQHDHSVRDGFQRVVEEVRVDLALQGVHLGVLQQLDVFVHLFALEIVLVLHLYDVIADFVQLAFLMVVRDRVGIGPHGAHDAGDRLIDPVGQYERHERVEQERHGQHGEAEGQRAGHDVRIGVERRDAAVDQRIVGGGLARYDHARAIYVVKAGIRAALQGDLAERLRFLRVVLIIVFIGVHQPPALPLIADDERLVEGLVGPHVQQTAQGAQIDFDRDHAALNAVADGIHDQHRRGPGIVAEEAADAPNLFRLVGERLGGGDFRGREEKPPSRSAASRSKSARSWLGSTGLSR